MKILKVFIQFCPLFISFLVFSQPSNDLCENAQFVNPTQDCTTVPGFMAGATISGSTPSCANTVFRDVWFSFTATTSSKIVKVSQTNSNLGFEVYEGTCGLTLISCTNNSSSTTALEQGVLGNLNIGTQYYIRVFQVANNNANTTFNICVQEIPGVNNNTCAEAIEIFPSATCVNTSGTLIGSSFSGMLPSCATNSVQDVWYKFEATTAANTISVIPSTNYSLGFEIYESTCFGAVTHCATSPQISIGNVTYNDFDIGTTYYIRVFNLTSFYSHNLYSQSNSNFNICVKSIPAPINDNCAGAIEIFPSTTSVDLSYEFAGSTLSQQAPSCNTAVTNDVWFYFTATHETIGFFDLFTVNGGYTDMSLELYLNDCTSTPIYCNHFIFPGSSSSFFYQTVYNDFVVGQTYYLRVFRDPTLYPVLNYNMWVKAFAIPPNNNCSSAQFVNVNMPWAAQVNKNFSGSNSNVSDPTCQLNTKQDLWYSFSPAHTTVSFLQHSMFEIYEGSCSGNPIHCITSIGQGQQLTLDGFTPGGLYFIRLFQTNTAMFATLSDPNSTVHLVHIKSNAPPSNNYCGNASTMTFNSGSSCVNGSFLGADLSTPAPPCAIYASQDMWFKFVAPHAFCHIGLSSYYAGELLVHPDFAIEVYESTCSGVPIFCANNQIGDYGESVVSNSFIGGSTYYIRVLNASTTLSNASYSLCIYSYHTNPNDNCSTPTNLTPNENCNTHLSTFSGSLISSNNTPCAIGASQDVWFKFLATQSEMSVNVSAVNSCSWSPNLAIEIYNELCSNNPIMCVDNYSCCSPESLIYNQFVPGTTYYVRVINKNSNYSTCSFNICVIGLAPYVCSPTISISSSTDLTICSGTMVTFTALSSNGGSNPTYEWFIDGVAVGSNSPEFSTSDLNDNSQVKCVINSNLWCAASNSIVESNTIMMNVLSSQPASFNATGPYCLGADIPPLPDVSLNGINGSWSPPINNQITTTYYFTPNQNSCNTSIVDLSVEVSTEINTSFVQLEPFCENESIPPLPSTSVNNITGTWYPEINNQETTTYLFTPEIGSCGTSTTMTIAIIENVDPVFDQIESICQDSNIAPLPPTSLNNILGTWSPNLNNQQTTLYTFSPDENQCATSFNMTITIIPTPQVQINLVGNSLFATTGYSSYSWYLNGQLINGANSSAYIPETNGVYEVNVYDSNGCIGISDFNYQSAQLSTFNSSFDFVVYPNPTDRLANIKIDSPEVSIFDLNIYDAQSKLLKTISLPANIGENHYQIDLSSLSSGLYLFNLSSNASNSMLRVTLK